MQLSGPSLGMMNRPVPRYLRRSPVLSGVGSAIVTNPLVALVGLVIGGYLAHKHIHPFGAVWGKLHAAHAREKALHGRRRRR